MRLAKSPAPEVKAASHPNSRKLGGIESRSLIAIRFSRSRSRVVDARQQAAGKMPITAPNGALRPKTKSRISAARALFVAIDLLALLVALLRFHRERRDGPGLEPLQRDRLAGILAI